MEPTPTDCNEVNPGFHALRGNPTTGRSCVPASYDAEHRGLAFHAERGNEKSLAQVFTLCAFQHGLYDRTVFSRISGHPATVCLTECGISAQ